MKNPDPIIGEPYIVEEERPNAVENLQIDEKSFSGLNNILQKSEKIYKKMVNLGKEDEDFMVATNQEIQKTNQYVIRYNESLFGFSFDYETECLEEAFEVLSALREFKRKLEDTKCVWDEKIK